MLRYSHKLIIIATLLSAVTACSLPQLTPFSTINTDRTAYLHKNFSSHEISPGVLARLPKFGDSGVNFHSIDLHIRSIYRAAGKTIHRKITQHIEKTDNGLLLQLLKYSQNDIPYLLVFDLDYGGFVSLKMQSAVFQKTYANTPIRVRKIKSVNANPFMLANNQTFEIKWEQSLDSYNAIIYKKSNYCRAGKEFSAASVSPKFTGSAQYFACNEYANGILIIRSRYLVLKDYQVAVVVESDTSYYKVSDTITNVTIK